ncbi:TetR/AcrR family transcriptional regulator [Streptomyces sp. NPDC017993]|uniref:TetR/AcrR family transcriptional regulator n=1 Tax=Streptomyces sp. NPDC017993 TaxID=3365027 RepID=UPI00379CBDE3
MPQRSPVGVVRPGGRTSRTRNAVLDAATTLIAEHGYGRLTIAAIAERSGVHGSTIRRRWHSVEAVVADILQAKSRTLPVPDTEDFGADLRALADAIAAFHADIANRNLIEGMVAAAVHDDLAAQVLRNSFLNWAEAASDIVRRAAARGDIPAGTRASDVIDALAAPFCYRIMVIRRPIDPALTAATARCVYWGTVNGAYLCDPATTSPEDGSEGGQEPRQAAIDRAQ